MINNCGDYVHLQVAERKILQEMIKIVRKKVGLIYCFLRCHHFLFTTELELRFFMKIWVDIHNGGGANDVEIFEFAIEEME